MWIATGTIKESDIKNGNAKNTVKLIAVSNSKLFEGEPVEPTTLERTVVLVNEKGERQLCYRNRFTRRKQKFEFYHDKPVYRLKVTDEDGNVTKHQFIKDA